MTENTADYFELAIEIEAEVATAARALLAALAHEPWPRVTSWVAPADGARAARTDELAAHLAGASFRSIAWDHGEAVRVDAVGGDGRTRIEVQLRDTEIEHAWRWLVASEEAITRLLAGDVPIALARLSWRGAGVRCLPDLPAIAGGTYVFASADDVLATGWPDVDAVVAAGGWDQKRIGRYRLLARAMHAETNVELLEAIQDGQWAMTRLARPKTCTYGLDPPAPEEEPVFRGGEPRVLPVGYDTDAAAAIYSCALADDEHVQPWEIWELGAAHRAGRLPSGELVRAIRVIFTDRASAERERRPLLDLGITVQCYGDAGELETLPEAPDLGLVDDADPLIAAACAAPADDGPRRALASWLDARGHALGAFMGLQLDRAVADHRTARPHPQASSEESALRPAAEDAWCELVPELARLRGRDRRFELVRGMPGALRVGWADLTDAVMGRVPLEHLDVIGPMPIGGVTQLLALPCVPQLRSLALVEVGLEDAALAELVRGDFRALRWLDLSTNGVSEAGAAALIATRRLPRLAVAKLDGNPGDPCEHGLDADEAGEADGGHDDTIVDTVWPPWAEALWHQHGEPPWQRVLWRRKRERPHRHAVWDALPDRELAGARLDGAVVLRGELEGLRAAGSTWRDANLAASSVHECDFTAANLTGATFTRGGVVRCRFARAASTDLDFAHARVLDCDFTGARLAEARFEGAIVTDCTFRDADLGCDDGIRDLSRTRGAQFVRCDFRGARFRGRELVDTVFRDCLFDGAPPT